MANKQQDDYQEEFQRMYMQYQMLKQQSTIYVEQLSIIEARITEIVSTIEAVNELQKNNSGKILANIGSQVYLKTDAGKTDNVIIELGAGIYASRQIADAIIILESRKNELMNVNNQILLEINKMDMQMKYMEPEMQKFAEKLK